MTDHALSKSTLFSSLPLSKALIQVTQELGYEKLTPVQAQSIPLLLEGRDLIGQSKTGSGKTAAFSLPVLQKLNLHGRRIQALVLCPTRELCTQVAGEMRKLGRKHPGFQVLVLAGGQPMYHQLNALEKGVHVVVGTPGRVLDHLKRKSLNLQDVTTLILDEADRMLDMGFEEEMRNILASVPKDRQTVFFSATFPKSILSLSETYQIDPIRVTVKEDPQDVPEIREVFYETKSEDKLIAILALLQQHQPESAIIFCNLKTTINDLAEELTVHGVSAEGLHGDLDQSVRDRVMAKFRNRSTRVLIATDVAARGIDIANLDIVFNFDVPGKSDVYTHRIGRTGRAGKKGLAISFATPREKGKLESYSKGNFEWGELDLHVDLDQPMDVETVHKTAAMETLAISGGRKDKLRPGDILGALTGEAGGLQGSDIGKIEIHDFFSYVAVSRHLAAVALQSLTDGRIKGRKFRIHQVK